jgi:ribosomal protein S6
MSESTMPVTEVNGGEERELVAYELAYHVLPTVAEGEVTTVSDTLKGYITGQDGSIFDEEEAKRFELAYEIEKYLDGKYRRFGSAYFGWVRFHLDAASLAAVVEEVDANKHLLRHLVVRLTKVEEENPFRFHESIKEGRVTTINLDEELEVEEVVEEGEVAEDVEKETADEVTEVKE